jgi:hypothetical protein
MCDVHDIRIIECPSCDGGTVYWSMRDYYEGRGHRCNACNGTGEIEEECPLITLDDLEEMHVERSLSGERGTQND